MVYGVEGNNGSRGAGQQEICGGDLEDGETMDVGGRAAGQGDQELELERAGCLIEVRVKCVTLG